MRRIAQLALRIFCVLLVCAAAPRFARAQAPASLQDQAADKASPSSTQTEQTGTQPNAPAPPDSSPDSGSGDTLTLFPHSDTSRYWISGQANIILQWHGAFPAKYSGPNSLRPIAENGTSKVYTLFLGY